MRSFYRIILIALLAVTAVPALGQSRPANNVDLLASDVARRMMISSEYLDLRALYRRRQNESGAAWTDSVRGKRILATLGQLRASAASANVLREPNGDRVVAYVAPDGQVIRLTSMIPSQIEKDAEYRNDAAGLIARSIRDDAFGKGLLLLPPLPAAARNEISEGIRAAGKSDDLGAIGHFTEALNTHYDPSGYRRVRAPEIFFNFGLAESKIPGRELRAIAWFGAYLTADPYTRAANSDVVVKQMKVLHAKEQSNLALWLRSLQDAAQRLSNPSYLYQMPGMWANAGDFAAALKAAQPIPESGWGKNDSYRRIMREQIDASDMAGALRTLGLIKDEAILAEARAEFETARLSRGGGPTNSKRPGCAQNARGDVSSDWLDLLNDDDQTHDCPLGHLIFTDFGGYLKAVERGRSEDLWKRLEAIAETKTAAKSAIGRMISAVERDGK